MGAAAGAAAGAALDAESLASGPGSAAGRPPGAGTAARAARLPEEGTGPAAVAAPAVVRGAPDTAVMAGTGGPGDTGRSGDGCSGSENRGDAGAARNLWPAARADRHARDRHGWRRSATQRPHWLRPRRAWLHTRRTVFC